MKFSEIIIRVKQIFSFVLVLFFSVSFCGCSRVEIKKNYTESEFSAEITWEREGESYSALMWAEKPQEATLREMTLEFLSPESMKGMKVEVSDEKAFLIMGDVRAELHNKAILEAAYLLSDTGSFSYCGSTTVADRELILVERLCGNERTEIYIDKDSGVPFRAVSKDLTVDVVWFEYLS